MHPEDKKRLFNWKWRLQSLYPIQTKQAEKTLLNLKPAQKRVASYFPHWRQFLILKARQVGISTLFLLWHLDGTLFAPNTTTAIISHEQKSLKKLFSIIRFAYEGCPDRIQLADGRIWEKPSAYYDNANELYFKETGSRIYVSLEVRSDTVHRLHVSEDAHIKQAEKVLGATLGAVVPDGIVSRETTANGMGGLFYDSWQQAMEGQNEYMPLFIGYQDDLDYCAEIEDEEAFANTLSSEEKTLLDLVPGMKLGNIAWRRRQMLDPARRRLFKQEFPCTAEEAFLTTGISPFDREKIMDWAIRAPIETKMEGRLQYWVKPIKGRRYIVSTDCASGLGTENLEASGKEGGTDYTAVGVFDCTTMQMVALFRGKWPYAKIHEIVYKLGREYNDAYIAIEATDHGLTVLTKLTETNYPKGMIHTTQTIDSKSQKRQQKWGWYTNAKTKPLIIDYLAELIDEELVKIYSKNAQNEFLRFIINEKGKYEAMEGYKDDIVMMSAIAYYLIPQALKAGRGTATKEQLGLSGM